MKLEIRCGNSVPRLKTDGFSCHKAYKHLLFITATLFCIPFALAEEIIFDDHALAEALEIPEWFKPSFLNIREELEEIQENGDKVGLIIYYGQKHCAYCKALLEVNFAKADIIAYTQKYFDIIAIDIWGNREVISLDGEIFIEKDFAEKEKTTFTPTLVFYTLEGKKALVLPGYYPPYKFRAALEYVAELQYKKTTFQAYLNRAASGMPGDEGLTEEAFFMPKPHLLTRNITASKRPLAVFFEQPNCHACDILHHGVLTKKRVIKALWGIESIQLNLWDHSSIITPSGKKTSINQWAKQLNIFYTPSIIFFDEAGNEIIRVDSVTYQERLYSVTQYVLSKAYQTTKNFQRWRTKYQATTPDDFNEN